MLHEKNLHIYEVYYKLMAAIVSRTPKPAVGIVPKLKNLALLEWTKLLIPYMLNLACSIFFADIHDQHNPSCECVSMTVEIQIAFST